MEQKIDYVDSSQFPDLGIPLRRKRKEQQACQVAVAECVEAIKRPGDFETFQEKAISMFKAFGVTPSPARLDQKWNCERLKEAHEAWDKNERERQGGGHYVDIEMRTARDGYVNVNLHHDFAPEKIYLFPGACSQGNLRRSTQSRLPVKNFARSFRDTIDPHYNWLNSEGGISPPRNKRIFSEIVKK